MATIDKIKQTQKSIEDLLFARIWVLLQLCDSEIEKLFFVQVVEFILKKEGVSYHHFDYEYQEVGLDYGFDYETCEFDMEFLSKKFLIPDPPNKGQQLLLVGIKFTSDYLYPRLLYKPNSNELEPIIRIDVSILPQYEINIGDSNFRLDFAIFSNKFSGDKHVETLKICVECDGHEFHKTPEQRTKDEFRSRKLMSKGWKVIRYTGREIFVNHGKDDLIEQLLHICNIDHR